jgi:hypothetical protein
MVGEISRLTGDVGGNGRGAWPAYSAAEFLFALLRARISRFLKSRIFQPAAFA